MMIFLLIAVGFLIYYILKNNSGTKLSFNGNVSPEETLKTRFINGEIDEETYNRMMKTIKS